MKSPISQRSRSEIASTSAADIPSLTKVRDRNAIIPTERSVAVGCCLPKGRDKRRGQSRAAIRSHCLNIVRNHISLDIAFDEVPLRKQFPHEPEERFHTVVVGRTVPGAIESIGEVLQKNKDVFIFLKNLANTLYRARNCSPDYDSVKSLLGLMWELFAQWNFIEGYIKRDVIADNIEAM